MGLEDLLVSAEKGLIRMGLGNRVTAAGYGCAAAGTIAGAALSYCGALFLGAEPIPTRLVGAGFLAAGAMAARIGYEQFKEMVVEATDYGRTTRAFYERTMRHVAKKGRLDERFVKRVILGSENERDIGYCQQQGVYLAARHTGHVGVFRAVAQAYSKVRVPFF